MVAGVTEVRAADQLICTQLALVTQVSLTAKGQRLWFGTCFLLLTPGSRLNCFECPYLDHYRFGLLIHLLLIP